MRADSLEQKMPAITGKHPIIRQIKPGGVAEW